ncbi:hypothetical protein, partial [Haloferax sp. Atlit-6N]
MSGPPFDALVEAIELRLRDGTVAETDLPPTLSETSFVSSNLELPQRCPNQHCRAPLRNSEVEEENQKLHTRCTGSGGEVHKETVDLETCRYFDLEWPTVLEAVTTKIDQELDYYDSQSLPSSVHGVTQAGLRVSIIGGRNPEREATQVYV